MYASHRFMLWVFARSVGVLSKRRGSFHLLVNHHRRSLFHCQFRAGCHCLHTLQTSYMRVFDADCPCHPHHR